MLPSSVSSFQGRVKWVNLISLVTCLVLLTIPSAGFVLTDDLYNSLFQNAGPPFKAKVETLGAVLKRHVQQLRSTENRQVDLVFLVDSSASVGGVYFKDEIKFVKKLLADFTVDVNTTRVSVITFSSREKVVRYIDHLTNPSDQNHKCSLLMEEIPMIKYIGGGTYTLGAFLEAKRVLLSARPDAVKAIFLITDGFSNGGDPRPEARRLKAEGVKIFTFGIRNGNQRELQELASEPRNETCYILNTFEEFEALARRALHADLHTGTFIPQPLKKCNYLCAGEGFCCHANASCACGTHTGKYECLCKPGYYGNGVGKDGCKPCPAGTYKDFKGSGDISVCTPCPDDNQVTLPGATLLQECKCKRGFRDFNSSECTVFRCPELQEPKNGYFVNKQCDNVFNAACGLRCQPGYELRGSSLRICQEDGTWSGQETECVLKTCPALPSPKNGHMVCTTDDFSYPTVCRFTCQAGYQLLGSRIRSCLAIALWTGIATRCREITCPPIPEIRDGTIHPPACTKGEVTFGTTCQLSCLRGYQLRGPNTKQCTTDGTWSAASTEPNQCLDKSPPFIQCPENIEVAADDDNDTAEVTWTVPVPVDNSGFIPVLTSDPAVVPPAPFPLGITIVTYSAEDLSQNVAKCKFYVLVLDKTPPRVDKCFSPDPVISHDTHGNVTWEEPIFSDNSGKLVEVQASHTQGLFPRGQTLVTYTAYDSNRNNNTCTLEVNVMAHPCKFPDPPANGERTCRESEEGVHCKLSCLEGYAFVVEPAAEYFCAYDNVWTPSDKLPFPDCAVQKISNEVILPASVTLRGDLSCAEHSFLNRVEQNIRARVTDKVSTLCEDNVICETDDITTSCEEHEDFNTINLVANSRRRRAVSWADNKHVRHRFASLKFDFTLQGTANATNDTRDAVQRQRELSASMKRLLQSLQSQAKKGEFDLYIAGRWLRFSDMDFDFLRHSFRCQEGSVLVNNTCVNCPLGMFYNVVTLQCQSCSQGTYQPHQGQVSCLVCPEKTSTYREHARSLEECRSQCLPGSVSLTGLERCETCAKGLYQPHYAQTACIPCPEGYTTIRRGARTQEQCREQCPPGHVSRSGLAPCYRCPPSTFQPDYGQTGCIRCPHSATTDHSAATSLAECQGDLELQSDDRGAYQNDEQQFLEASECFNLPCLNGATCLPDENGLYVCKCAPGFEGVFCQTEVDHCEARPCLNGGQCSSRPGGYFCRCPAGFTGQKCERDIDECLSAPCQNGATCVDGANSFTCNCPNGFQGVTCETDVNDCADQPCLNGGTCQDDVSGYRCTCPAGFSGATCEIEADECLSSPCANGATCVDAPNDYTCECVAGYTGRLCEVEILECASRPCQNGAKCEDLINSYLCHCKEGFAGQNCETELDGQYQMDFPGVAASTVEYAILPIDRPLSSVTVSFWMKTNDTGNYGTPFSYAVADEPNTLTLTDYNGFVFYVNKERVVTDVKANDDVWHHIVITWSSVRGSWKLYMDGILNDSGFDLSTARPLPGKGLLVIGQEQDSLGGDFSPNEAFVGSITQFNMWDTELPLQSVESMRVSCSDFHGNVISWPQVQSTMRGGLAAHASTFCQECPRPTAAEYGFVNYTSLTPGSEVRFSCMRGFRVTGQPSSLCLVTGEWELSPPACQRVECGNPGIIENGYLDGWRFTFDNRVRFHCNKGYKLQGSETLYCNEYGTWEGQRPTCVEISCSLPALSENTVVSTPKETFRPGETASFGCTPGNKLLTEHSSVSCQSDGTWDRSVPTCDPQTCGSPPMIDSGEPDTRHSEYNVGDIVRYSCEFGYSMSQDGPNPAGAITCLPVGQWEENLPVCQLVTCDEPPVVAHATTRGTERTFLSRVTYECQPGYVLEGGDSIECLETGDWDPAPPSCTPVSCGPLPDLPHGQVVGTDYTYNSMVTCSCDLGYKLVGSMRRRCDERGQWEGPDPVCKPVSCGRLNNPANGRVRAPIITFQAQATYECDEGYTLQGDPTRTCGEDSQWSGAEPVCDPVNCGPVIDVEHGSYKGPAQYTYGARVVYSCQQGYRMEGNSDLVCLSSGYWSNEAPQCLPVECPQPEIPEHGSVQIHGTTFTSKVVYSCEEGFELDGPSIRTCGANAAWTEDDPFCRAIMCEPPPPIDNGNYDYKDLKVGSILRYSCDSGYVLNGDEVRRCLEDLSLSGSEPHCDRITCPQPDAPEHGSVAISDSALIIGTTALYSCNVGYLLLGEATRTCNDSGEFTGLKPSCKIVECTRPSEVLSNGQIIGSSFTFGSAISYTCNEGYRLDGSAVRLCRADGTWDQPIPSCLIVECPAVRIANGFASTFQRSYSTVVSFSCQAGYNLLGPQQLTCLASGSWNGTNPVCNKITCPTPQLLENGRFRLINDTYVQYHCSRGFRLVGSNASRCSIEGQWAPLAPVCEIVTCADLSSAVLPYGRVLFVSANYGSAVRYVCDAGYRLIGVSERDCAADGRWEGEEPTCKPISCLTPSSLVNGFVRGTNFSFKAEVRYECKEGHVLVGPETRTCQENGLWTEHQPRCEAIVCPNLDKIENGVVTVVSNTFGGIVRYSCLPSFALQGNANRTCLATGQWSGETPACVPLTCSEPPEIHNGYFVGQDFRIGRTIRYVCHMGYTEVGMTVSTCLPNLMWSSFSLSCEPVSCLELQPLMHGQIEGDGRRYKDQVLYTCDEGYELMGDYRLTCLDDGTWSSESPMCSAVSCGLPPIIANAVPDLSNGTMYPAVIRYACDLGYIGRGNMWSTCQSDAIWSTIGLTCELVSCPAMRAVDLPSGVVTGDLFTYNEVVRFSCNEGFRLEGSETATCQANGTWSSITPRCVAIICPEPSPMEHGSVFVQGYSFGSTATYECHVGYRLIGDRDVTCSGAGEWSRSSRTCELVRCSPPLPFIQNGRLLQPRESYDYQDWATYECDLGFEILGTAVLTCTADGVFIPNVPTCSKIQCPNPAPPIHGYLEVEEDVLVYRCSVGHELLGDARRRCLVTGQWEGEAPVCVPIVCPTPESVSNGHISGTEFTYESSVTYFCNPGFQLAGTPTASCLATGAWSAPPPTCERISCGPVRPVEFSRISGRSFLYNDTVNYTCEPGFSLLGHSVRTCLVDGTWSGEDPLCQEIMCEDPPDVVNATHDAANDDSPHFGYGFVVEYTCDAGHAMAGLSTIVCQENGTWSLPPPACPPVSCPLLPSPENGHLKGDDVTFGATIVFSCNSGYLLKGRERLTCAADAAWDGPAPDCQLVTCTVPELEHGYALLQGHVDSLPAALFFLPGQTVVFVCHPGYRSVPGVSNSMCTDDGLWSNPPPACNPVTCSTPPPVTHSLPFGDVVYRAGDVVTYSCGSRYTLHGQPTVTCTDDGEWAGETPSCIDLTCGLAPQVANARAGNNNLETAVGESVQYVCVEGYSMAGGHSGLLPCLEGGIWGRDLPRCVHVDCGPPPVPFFASVTTRGTTAGSVASVTCNPGYQHGDGRKVVEVVCDISGRWAGSEVAACSPVDCDAPPAVRNSALLGDARTTFEAEVTYQCLPGYAMTGNSNLRCGSNGQWEGTPPTCEPVSCGPPPTNLQFTRKSFTLGDEVILTCPSGWRLLGASRITCTLTGQWSPEPGRCEEIRCGPLDLPENSYIRTGSGVAGAAVGNQVELSCHDGSLMTGDPVVTCLPGGVWSSPLPTCQRSRSGFADGSTCADTVDLPNAASPPRGRLPGETVVLICRPGYRPEGNMTSLCQNDKTWGVPSGSCVRLSCGPPPVDNIANVKVLGRSHLYGDRVMFVCRPGLSPVRNPPTLTCTETGEWDAVASCAALCKFRCLNGGMCVALNKCKCMAGYAGTQCDIPICILPCLNGSKCQGPYSCQCSPGFRGSRCQEAICSRPCQHGGRCIAPNRCQCINGYLPPFCETPRFPEIQAN